MARWFVREANPLLGIAAGSDAANGTSRTTPFKTLAQALTKVAAGDRISLSCGSIWSGTGSVTWDFAGKQPAYDCVIDYYDDDLYALPPIIDPMLYHAPGAGSWSYQGAGRWQCTIATGTGARRLWGGIAYGQMLGQTHAPMRLMSSAAAVTALAQFYATGTTLTVYTGSATQDPPTYYGGLAISVVGSGNIAIRIRDNTNLRFKRICVQGGNHNWGLQCGSIDNSNITLEDCLSLGNFANGFNLDAASATLYNRDIKIIRPYVDAVTTANENTGSSAAWGGQNGILVTGLAKNIQIVDWLLIKGQRHAGLMFQPNATGGINGVTGVAAYTTSSYYGLIDCRDIDYGHPFTATVNGWFLAGARIESACTQAQVAGTGTFTRSTMRGGREATTTNGNIGSDNAVVWYNYDADLTKPVAVTLSHLLVENPRNYAFAQSWDSTQTNQTASNAVTVEHCTVIDQANYTGKRSLSQNSAIANTSATVLMQRYGSGASPTQTFRNNHFVLPPGQSNVFAVSQSSGSTYDSYAVSGYSGAASCLMHTSLSAAGLSATFRPSASSPGYRAGAFTRYGYDLDGRQRWNPPSIGAYEAL